MEVNITNHIQITLSEYEARYLKQFIGRKNEPTIINGSIHHQENGMYNTMSELYHHLDDELSTTRGLKNG